MKHLQHHPDPVEWYQCEKCGQPKKPHRFCSTHIDICALKPADYAKVKADRLAKQQAAAAAAAAQAQ